MRYLFVGDTHHELNLDKLRSPEVAALNLLPQDALIHCGDFGAPWRTETDDVLSWWQSRPYKVIINLGNHENFGWILHQPVIQRFGCRGYDLGGNLFAPLPGEVALIGGKRFWFYPGGFSIDFFLRKPGLDVFAEELLPNSQAQDILARFFRRRVPDYIISHDGPRSFIMTHFGFPIAQPPDAYFTHTGSLPGSRAHPAFVLDQIYHARRFHTWFFGHHHRDMAADGLRCLYHQMVLVDSRSGESRLIVPEPTNG